MLNDNMNILHVVANALMEREKLSGEEFEKLFNGEKLEEIVDITNE